MHSTEDNQPGTQPLVRRRRFGSFRLYLNVFCILIVSIGLWQAVMSALGNLRQIEKDYQDRITLLTAGESTNDQQSEPTATSIEVADLKKLKASLWTVETPWLIAAVLCTVVGILFPGIYWFLTLRSLGIHVPWQIVARAYYLGNLGKYVPGKAMVLIMRAAALKPFGASIKLTTISVFVETLTTMAVGAAMGALIVLNLNVPRWLQWMGIVTSICAVAPTLPLVFRPILKYRLPVDDPLGKALDQEYNSRLMLKGWLLSICSWFLLGSSLYCTVRAIPLANSTSPSVQGDRLQAMNSELVVQPSVKSELQHTPRMIWVICLAACALSVVAGFISMLPGGAGVRELVLLILLSPIVGEAAALVVAIVHRLATIIGELLVAAVSLAIQRFVVPVKPTQSDLHLTR